MHGSANMDVLIAMGTSAAYFYSVGATIERMVNPMAMGVQFFETSAMLITFVMMGKWLEALAKGEHSVNIQ
jgi:Cu+-exporting ATPase